MVGSRPPEACLGPHCTRFRPLAAEARGSEWGRGGSGAQAHSSPSELRARASCTHRAQRARGPGRQVRPVPWRPEVRFHPGERSHPLEKARSVLPPGVLPVRGNTRLPAPILAPSSRGRSPGTRSSSAPTLETFGGGRSLGALDLAGIHLRLPPRAEVGPCLLQSVTAVAGIAPERALHGVAPAEGDGEPREFKETRRLGLSPHCGTSGVRTSRCLKATSPNRTRLRVEKTPPGGRAPASGPQPGPRCCAGF